MYVCNNMIYDLIKYVYIQTYCNCNSYESNIDLCIKKNTINYYDVLIIRHLHNKSLISLNNILIILLLQFEGCQ